ncbi:SNF2 family N-terminal domain-containing protein [Aspergillus aurantiobrunneus]
MDPNWNLQLFRYSSGIQDNQRNRLMSLKRLLNPPGRGNQSQNDEGWKDDDRRVRQRLEVTEQWPANSIEYNTTQYSYHENVPFGNSRDGGDLMLTEFDPGELGVQICYGMVLRERVRLLGKGQALQDKFAKLREDNPAWIPCFGVQRSDENGELFLSLPDGTSFGYLSEKMVEALENLIGRPRFELEAYTQLAEVIDAIRRAGKAADAKFRVNINVYGLESDRDQVGRELSRSGLFLQVPDVFRANVRYDNPHMLRLDGMDETDTDTEEEDAAEVEPEGEEVEVLSERDGDFDEIMAEVFGSLRRQEGLNRLEGGENLNGRLYPHQEEALDFMTQRETGYIEDEYRLWQPKMIDGSQVYCHVITNTQQREEPDESGGGILADEMGMGKSLTMLVLIGKTIKEARQWVEYRKGLPDAALAETPCQATLVVVPSRVLINTWMREIDNHLKGGIKALLYHGRSRKESIQEIERYKIVVTTYNTLAKEHSAKLLGRGKSPLHEFAWYRVVLDEAHMIRRRETTFHKAVVELSAKSRWCLSGTPIQNSLADLASLLAFIQVRPFHDPRNFRHWIAHPFEVRESKRKAIQHLTDLLEAICLRRTIGRVNLPKPQEETRVVQLTPEESAQYKLTYADMQRYIIQQAGEYNERASTFGMFQVFLQLRSFCNHGTYQPRFSWAKRNLLDEEADSVRSLTRNSLDRCLGCRQPLPVVARDCRPKYAEKCGHVLCDECCKGSSDGNPGSDGRLHCPLCESVRRPNSDDTHDNYLLSEGYSSKMQALIADVQQNIGTTQSIIFSCWTRTLDLIAKHLRKAKIRFRRIDGKTLPSERQQILDRFDGTRDVPVLIMTTGTGAFGLNLQSVNRVFIVEPQWNPSVESQAVARAIRLGQEQQVLVTRYRVANSIEEDMCSQQMHKLTLSKMDFGRDLVSSYQEDPHVIHENLSRLVPVE